MKSFNQYLQRDGLKIIERLYKSLSKLQTNYTSGSKTQVTSIERKSKRILR